MDMKRRIGMGPEKSHVNLVNFVHWKFSFDSHWYACWLMFCAKSEILQHIIMEWRHVVVGLWQCGVFRKRLFYRSQNSFGMVVNVM